MLDAWVDKELVNLKHKFWKVFYFNDTVCSSFSTTIEVILVKIEIDNDCVSPFTIQLLTG